MRFLFTISYINLRILGSKGNTELCDCWLYRYVVLLVAHIGGTRIRAQGSFLRTGRLTTDHWYGKERIICHRQASSDTSFDTRTAGSSIRSLSTNAVWLAYDVFVDRQQQQQHSINNLLVSAAQIIGGASTSNIETSKLLITWRLSRDDFPGAMLAQTKMLRKDWKNLKSH